MNISIARIEAFLFRAEVKEPVKTSFGSIPRRSVLLLRVEDTEGAHGWGEVWCNFPPFNDAPLSRADGITAFWDDAIMRVICPTGQVAFSGCRRPVTLHGVVFDLSAACPFEGEFCNVSRVVAAKARCATHAGTRIADDPSTITNRSEPRPCRRRSA